MAWPAVLVLAILGFAPFAGAPAERAGLLAASVQVIDGDTIRHNGIRIRLSDINTPEISQPKCAREAELGYRAKQRLQDLLNAGPFQIVATGPDEDRYGRKLREIRRDGRSLGDVLVSEGLAHRWRGYKEDWC